MPEPTGVLHHEITLERLAFRAIWAMSARTATFRTVKPMAVNEKVWLNEEKSGRRMLGTVTEMAAGSVTVVITARVTVGRERSR